MSPYNFVGELNKITLEKWAKDIGLDEPEVHAVCLGIFILKNDPEGQCLNQRI